MLLINAGQIALDSLAAQPPALVEAFYPSFGAPAIVAQVRDPNCVSSNTSLHRSLALQLFGSTNLWGRLPYTIYPAAFATAINISDAGRCMCRPQSF